MKQYKIEIEETVSQVFEVNADSEEEALKIAEAKYKSAEFVLEPGNLIDTIFTVLPEEEK